MNITLAEYTVIQTFVPHFTQKPASVNILRGGVAGALPTDVAPLGIREEKSGNLRRGVNGRAVPQRGSLRPSKNQIPLSSGHVPRRQCNRSALRSKSARWEKVRVLIEVRFRSAGLIHTGRVRDSRGGDVRYQGQNMLAKLHGEVAG